MGKITTLRRFVQVISFVVIVYGGIIFQQQIDTPLLPFVKAPEEFESEGREVLPGPEYKQVLDTYAPIKSCRLLREKGMFRGCFLHFLSESITWATPLKYFLPHLFLFVAACFFFGRFWCGWICPLGFISDVLTMIRRSLGLRHIKLPEAFQEGLAKFKYILLSFIILISLAIAIPILPMTLRKEMFIPGCQMCPGRFVFPFFAGETPTAYGFYSPTLTFFSSLGLLFLSIFFMGFFVRRFWCRICPSGAFISLFNVGGAITKEKDVQKCTRCGTCERVCVMQNKKVYEERVNEDVSNAECILCLRCVDSCPQDDCLKVKFLGNKIFKSKFK